MSVKGRYKIENIKKEDLKCVIEIVEEQGWEGYGVDDLNFVFNISSEAAFKLIFENELVGAVFALNLGGVSHISFFIIKKNFRDFKMGNTLGQKCLELSLNSSLLTVIYANRLAVNAYLRKGFIPLFDVKRIRLKGKVCQDDERIFNTENNFTSILNLDKQIYNFDRSKLFNSLMKYKGARCFVLKHTEEKCSGYAFVREVKNEIFVGPLTGVEEKDIRGLLRGILKIYNDKYISLDVPMMKLPVFRNIEGVEVLEEDLIVKKMFIGERRMLEDDDKVYAIGGHHFS